MKNPINPFSSHQAIVRRGPQPPTAPPSQCCHSAIFPWLDRTCRRCPTTCCPSTCSVGGANVATGRPLRPSSCRSWRRCSRRRTTRTSFSARRWRSGSASARLGCKCGFKIDAPSGGSTRDCSSCRTRGGCDVWV